jgi:hypothetical protein
MQRTLQRQQKTNKKGSITNQLFNFKAKLSEEHFKKFAPAKPKTKMRNIDCKDVRVMG